MHYVYIIKSLHQKWFYKGITNNSQRRLQQHNEGKCRSTKNRKLFVLVYKEAYKTGGEARKREKYFKAGSGRRVLERLLGSRYNK